MSNSTNLTSLIAEVGKDEDDGTDLISTIVTAVAPLLVLFGELATKQFLSLSMGWKDDILLAMGPIGIITIIVSTIRIGGFPWLRAIVGRARESRAKAEEEFLSSTSAEVCELWSGQEIIRTNDVLDNQCIKNIVITSGDHASFLDTFSAESQRLLKLKADGWPDTDTPLDDMPPNITLNIKGSHLLRWEMWLWTVVAVILQSFSLAFPGAATFHYQWQRKGKAVPSWAYWLFFSGMVANVLGLFVCGRIIETSTAETEYQRHEDGVLSENVAAIVQVQIASVIGTQSTPSCVLILDQQAKTLKMSWLRPRRDLDSGRRRVVASLASLVAIVGFAVQVIGLSVLHWSATLAVLIVSLLMACVRAWVRRGLARPPDYAEMPAKQELSWLVQRAMKNDWSRYIANSRWDDARKLLRNVKSKISSSSGNNDMKPEHQERKEDLRTIFEFIWGPPIALLTRMTVDGDQICTDQTLSNPKLVAELFEEERQVATLTYEDLDAVIDWNGDNGGDNKDEARRTLSCMRDHVREVNSLPDYPLRLGLFDSKADETSCIEMRLGLQARDAMPALRQGLGQELGSKVATALLNIIGRLGEALEWRDEAYRWPPTSWSISVKNGESYSGNHSWNIPLSNRSSDPRLVSTLATGLSHWLYSLHGSDIILAQLPDIAEGEISSSWKNDPGHYMLRILGSCDQFSLADLRTWIPNQTFEVLDAKAVNYFDDATEKRRDSEFARRAKASGTKHSTSRYKVHRPLNAFGAYNSSAVQFNLVESSTMSDNEVPFWNISANTKEAKAAVRDIVYFSPMAQDPDFSTACGLDMINLFMISVCARIDKIQGGNAAAESLCHDLANDVVAAGLCRTKAEALMCIVPPFLRFGFLMKSTPPPLPAREHETHIDHHPVVPSLSDPANGNR